MSELTAPQLAWIAAGRPDPGGKTGQTFSRVAPAEGVCACCAGGWLDALATPLATSGRGDARLVGIDNPTFSGHADYLRFGTEVCAACAWLYGDPKRTHRSMLVIGPQLWWPTIAEPEPARPIWDTALPPNLDAGALSMTGLLTTDPKPRLWPRMQVASLDAPGLYVHAPDYDISGWLSFDWRALADSRAAVAEALAAGWSRREVLSGPGGPKGDLSRTLRLEDAFASRRGSAELVIATIITRKATR